MKIYTIGFTRKTAQEFFELLNGSNIQLLIDIRLKPSGQLSGFAKGEDLVYFLDRLVKGCQYIHWIELAPTHEILTDFRSNNDWQQYVTRFEMLMDEREIPRSLNQQVFEQSRCCFLCSEDTPEKCHRRLVAERLARNWPDVGIIHL